MAESDFCTPRKPTQSLINKIKIPPSPFMKKIGYGKGIAVYELQRSPAFNKLRSPWAIKKLLKRSRNDTVLKNRLKNEAEILRKLVHPNIVGFRAFVEKSDGSHMLAMEECTSCLADLIEDRWDTVGNPFAAKIITKVALDVAMALSYLHNTALVMHCDLKSFNVLVQGKFETCKLCDFGVSLPVNKEGSLDTEKAPGAEFIGTTSWCAPEVLCYPQVITTKADIYSFGLIIWEMIALSPPICEDLIAGDQNYLEIEQEKLVELLEKMKMTFRKRPAIPENVDIAGYEHILEIYYCCTEEDKKKRPPAADLAVILNDIFDEMASPP